MKTFGILAFPAGHSLSPQMQNAAFQHQHIDATFVRFEIPPTECVSFFHRVRSEPIAGLAVSIPHKESIFPFLDHVSEKAQKIGAVNTVFWKKKELCGDNTDADGFWEAVSPFLNAYQKKAAIIGSGGAARAMLFALKERGFSLTLFSRTAEKGALLAHEYNISWSPLEDFTAKAFDIVANASAAGLKKPEESAVSQESWDGFSGIAFDAVFDPLITRFLAEAKNAGGQIITGEKMLLFQGMRQFEIWTGEKAPETIMAMALQAAQQKS